MLSETKIKKAYNFLVFSALIMYILFLAVKNSFTAEITTIMDFFAIDKPTASMTTTYYFFTYGITQIFLFFFISKFNLKWFLTTTLSISAILMFVVGFCTNIVQIYIIYAISGIMQAGLWAGIIAVLSLYLPKKLIAGANKILSIGMPVAGGLSYGVSAIFNSFGNWSGPFIIMGALVFVAVWVFYLAIINVQKVYRYDLSSASENTIVESKEKEIELFDLSTKLKKILFYLTSFALSFLSTSIYFAILNWIPSLMVDIYEMSNSVSTLITTIVPLSIIAGPIIVINYCEKYKNLMLVAAVFFAMSIIFVLYMVFFYSFNLIASLVILIILLNIVHGARSIFSSIMAFKIRNQVNSGGYAAIANAFASLGASFAPTIIGAIIESAGWGVSYLTILIINIVLVALLILFGMWSRKHINKQKAV